MASASLLLKPLSGVRIETEGGKLRSGKVSKQDVSKRNRGKNIIERIIPVLCGAKLSYGMLKLEEKP